MYIDTNKASMINKCTSSAGHFDGHGGALERYRRHRPMQRVQGYYRSHWMPALGDYSLHIAPAATRATGIQTTINKHTCEDGHFDGHGDAPVPNRAVGLLAPSQRYSTIEGEEACQL